MRSNYIAGEWVAGGEATPNVNPSDVSDVIDEYAVGDAAAVDRAVLAARAAFPKWSLATPQQRFDALDMVGTEILARRAELGELLSREEGKTLPEGIGEVVRAGSIFKFFAGEALRTGGEVVPSVRPGLGVEITREPVGVVGLIAPWNFPIAIPAWKIAPALAYGNCVVFKPAELVPGSAWALAEILSRAGTSAGGIQPGDGPRVGDRAGAHRPPRGGCDQLHRLGRHRAAGRRSRPEALRQDAARDGRQEPAGGAGRRGPRAGGGGGAAGLVLLDRAALHRLQPAHRHRRDPRCVREAPGRAHERAGGGRCARPEDPDRAGGGRAGSSSRTSATSPSARTRGRGSSPAGSA